MNAKNWFLATLLALTAGAADIWAETQPGSWGNIPALFEANRGQSAPEVRYLVRGNGYGVFLTDDKAVIGFSDSKKTPLTMTFVDRNAQARFEGLEPQPGANHYFTGAGGVEGLQAPRFSRVSQRNIWRNVDVVYHIHERQLEYDFIVSPGGRLADIRLDFSGGPMSIDADGNLVFRVEGGRIQHERPIAYQEKNGKRQPVRVQFKKLGERRVGFDVGPYDHRLPLVIDPKLDYSTFWGGGTNTTLGELGWGVTVDALGNTYVAGITGATDFPLASPVQGAIGGNTDAFVTKIGPDGTSVVFSTYIGGTSADEAHDIKVDSDGNVYITGFTLSANFPIVNGFQRALGGNRDAFLVKLSPDGNAILYSTFIGGNGEDRGYGVAVSPEGDAYVTGPTQSNNFPIENATQPVRAGGLSDAFVTKIARDGRLAYSTYVGGAGVDHAYDITLGPDGSAYITGYTTSLNFPRVNEAGIFTPFIGAPDDAFIVRLGPSGNMILAMLLGGTGSDEAVSIALDQNANIYVTGFTASVDFPIWNALQPVLAGAADVFVSRIRSDGALIDFSTFWGSTEYEGGVGIAVDASGFVHVTGFTGSFAFPLINAFQDRLNLGTPELVRDAFLLKLNGEGTAVVYSTYLGGRANDGALGLAVDAAGNAYVTGYTTSPQFPDVNTEFPVANALQPQPADAQDTFVLKFNAQDVVGAINTQVPALGLSRVSLGGIQRNALFGYADLTVADGVPRPAGLEIIRVRQLDRTVSELGLPLTPPIQHARVFVETMGDAVRESIAIVNPGDVDVTLNFTFTVTILDENGVDTSVTSDVGTVRVFAKTQLFVLLTDFPFFLPRGQQGTLTLDADGPLSVAVVRALINSSSNLILSRIPVHNRDVADTRPAIVDHFVEGGGWHTQVVLVNHTENDIGGTFQFWGPGNAPATEPLEMEMSHAVGTIFPYRVPARSVIRVSTAGLSEEFKTGFIKIVPTPGSVTPSAFTFLDHGDDTSTTLDARAPGDRFRLYVESNPGGATELVRRFAIGMTNSSDGPVTALLELTDADGAPTGVSAEVTLPPGTQISRFIDEIPGLETAPAPFTGLMKVTVITGLGLTVTGVQSLINEEGAFLMNTTGPIREDAVDAATTVFPYIPTGAQYSTSLILFGTPNGAGSSGQLRTWDSVGTPLFLVLE